jgi:hypothetical protein
MNHQYDINLLFSTRIIRLFCYGFLSVVLALYLTETGFDEKMVGLLFTLTLAQALHYGSPRTQIGLGVEKPY